MFGQFRCSRRPKANDLASGIKDPERNTLAPSQCTSNVDRSVLTVVKIGGSVLTDQAAYRRTAEVLATRVRERASERIVAVVSAGATNGCRSSTSTVVSVPDGIRAAYNQAGGRR